MPAQIRIKRTFGTSLPDFPPVGTGVTDGELVYVYDTNNLGIGGSYRKLYIGSAAGVSTLAYPVGGQYYMERLPDSPFQEGVLLPRKVLSADANSVIDRIQVGSGLTVSGISTFKDNVNIEGNVSVDGNLDVTGDLTFDEFSARQVVISGVATVNQAVSIGGTLDVPEAYISSGIVTDIQVSGASTVTGIATFQSDVYVAGNLNVAGDIAYDEVRGRNLNISGVGTITNFNSGLGTITTLDTETFDALNAKITAGVVTSLVGTYATVSTVDVETLDAKNVNITGLAVTDVVGTAATITTIDASNLDALSANITGLAVTDIVGTAATITTIDSSKADLLAANINVGMITSAYITSGIVTDIKVSGASTVTGIATFQSDVYVSGNLSVSGDIVYDEVVGRNINISGVGTIANFNSGLGTITTLDVETLDARTANITGLAVTDVVGTAATITTLDVNAGDILNAKITAGVVTSLVGTYATVSTVDIETLDAKNVNITGLAVTDTVGTAATITTLDVNTGDIQTLLVNAGLATDFAVTNLRSQTGIITNAYINSGVVTSLTGTYSTITNLVGTSGTFQDFDVNVNLNVDGHTELDNVNVSGIITSNSLSVLTNFDVYDTQAVFHNDLFIAGNLSIGGTTSIVLASDLFVIDKTIVLGITTDSLNVDIANDDTANGGGISIASTEGNPLVSLQAVGVNSLPNTHKKILWSKANTYGVGTTDAWLFNYAVGVGSTNVPNQAYMAVGAHHFYERKIESPNITISENAVVSGILTGTTFDSETAIIDNLQVAGTTTTGQLSVTGVSTFQSNVNLGDNDRLRLGDNNDLQILHDGSNSYVISNTGSGSLYITDNLEIMSISKVVLGRVVVFS
jgi:cytoskeletal protein CcmA (bactofilin family)